MPYFDWIAGGVTIIAMELVARRRWEGWAVGLVNQVFWLGLIFHKQLWGLLPLTVILSWRFSVALAQWREESNQ